LKGTGRLVAKWLSKNSIPVTSAAKALTNSRAFTVALKVLPHPKPEFFSTRQVVDLPNSVRLESSSG
jgi:hypothetical protein